MRGAWRARDGRNYVSVQAPGNKRKKHEGGLLSELPEEDCQRSQAQPFWQNSRGAVTIPRCSPAVLVPRDSPGLNGWPIPPEPKDAKDPSIPSSRSNAGMVMIWKGQFRLASWCCLPCRAFQTDGNFSSVAYIGLRASRTPRTHDTYHKCICRCNVSELRNPGSNRNWIGCGIPGIRGSINL